MKRKGKIIYILIIVFTIIDLWLYFSDLLKKGLKFPLILFLIIISIGVFIKRDWTRLLVLIMLIFLIIAYYFNIDLSVITH